MDKTCREQTKKSATSFAARFFIFFLNQLNMSNLSRMQRTNCIFSFFLFFLFFWLLLFVFSYGESLTGKLKHVRLLLEWKCAARHIDGDKHRQTDVFTFSRRQKAYRVLVTEGRGANPSARGLIGSLVKGSNPVLASHLHLLIKCHDNMIFNFQRASPLLPRPRDQRPTS